MNEIVVAYINTFPNWYSIHVMEQFSCTICEIVCTKMNVFVSVICDCGLYYDINNNTCVNVPTPDITWHGRYDKLTTPMFHRFTYPKGVHSYRYFLQPMRTPKSLPPAHAYSPILLLTSHAYMQLDLYAYSMVYALAV